MPRRIVSSVTTVRLDLFSVNPYMSPILLRQQWLDAEEAAALTALSIGEQNQGMAVAFRSGTHLVQAKNRQRAAKLHIR